MENYAMTVKGAMLELAIAIIVFGGFGLLLAVVLYG